MGISQKEIELLVLIRRFEELVLKLFSDGKISGTTHTCIGQEYVPVSIRRLISRRDHVFSNHRGHGHYIAYFNDPDGLLAELMGRDHAVCNGVGGSQHICRENFLSTGVIGQSVGIAAGIALHLKRSKSNLVSIVYIGDGAWGAGATYEALNMAKLMDLPLVVVVENNGIAQTTPSEHNIAGSIKRRAAAFDIAYQHIESLELDEIELLARPLVERVRANGGPLIIEFACVRLGPHSKGDDTRSAMELERARACDWYTHYTKQFPKMIALAEQRVQRQLDELLMSVSKRRAAKWIS